MATGFNMKVTGLEEAFSKMNEIASPKQTDSRLNFAMRKSAQPALEAAKAKVSERQGALKRSLIINSKKVRGNRTVRVGPDSDYVEASLEGSLDSSGSGQLSIGDSVRPAKYAHLVEYGTSHSPPHPFIRPAGAAHGGEVFVRRVAEGLRKSYERLARKVGKL